MEENTTPLSPYQPPQYPDPARDQNNADNTQPRPMDGDKASQSDHSGRPVESAIGRKQYVQAEPDCQIQDNTNDRRSDTGKRTGQFFIAPEFFDIRAA